MPKSVLITGCSKGGIGDALAREFHVRGLTVFATARNMAKMAELAKLGVTTLEMDVTSLKSIIAATAAVRKATGGKLDILINNAGVIRVMPFLDDTLEELKRVMDTNVFGVFSVTHTFLPLLLASGGLVANISSIITSINPPCLMGYNASKAALDAFGHTLRQELAPLGVRVVTIKTGLVRTHLLDTLISHLPENSLYEPLKELLETQAYLKKAKCTEVADYARQVVSDLLRDKPKAVYWRASMSTYAYLVRLFGWVTMLDGPSSKAFALDKVHPPLKKQKTIESGPPDFLWLRFVCLLCVGLILPVVWLAYE